MGHVDSVVVVGHVDSVVVVGHVDSVVVGHVNSMLCILTAKVLMVTPAYRTKITDA